LYRRAQNCEMNPITNHAVVTLLMPLFNNPMKLAIMAVFQ
jgi:hypothetical protein